MDGVMNRRDASPGSHSSQKTAPPEQHITGQRLPGAHDLSHTNIRANRYNPSEIFTRGPVAWIAARCGSMPRRDVYVVRLDQRSWSDGDSMSGGPDIPVDEIRTAARFEEL